MPHHASAGAVGSACTILLAHVTENKMAKRLIPLLDRVLVEKIVAPTKSVGGILLPESAVSKVRVARGNSSDRVSLFAARTLLDPFDREC